MVGVLVLDELLDSLEEGDLVGRGERSSGVVGLRVGGLMRSVGGGLLIVGVVGGFGRDFSLVVVLRLLGLRGRKGEMISSSRSKLARFLPSPPSLPSN